MTYVLYLIELIKRGYCMLFKIICSLFLVGLGSSVASCYLQSSAKEKNEKAKDICERARRKYNNQFQETKRDYEDLSDAVSFVIKSKEKLINNPVHEFKQSLDMIKHTDIFDINADSGDSIPPFGYKEIEKLKLDDVDLMVPVLISTLNPICPILNVPSIILSKIEDTKADANLSKARAYKAECDATCENLKIQSVKFQAMRKQFLIYYELMAKIGTIFEDYNKRTSKIINAHRDVLSKHKLNKTRDIFDTHELEIIKTTLNLFNTVKTLCMKNLLVKNNDAVELNPEFNEKFIDGVRMIADSHKDIIENNMPTNIDIICDEKQHADELQYQAQILLREELRKVIESLDKVAFCVKKLMRS